MPYFVSRYFLTTLLKQLNLVLHMLDSLLIPILSLPELLILKTHLISFHAYLMIRLGFGSLGLS